MQLPYSSDLQTEYLSRLFDNKSECYKLFWFQALLGKITEDKDVITYEELVNEMIADSWYMVTEYHLNLGPKDNLEAAVKYLSQLSGIKSSEKKDKILDFLARCQDKEFLRLKKVLIDNVPYRLQAPFLPDIKGREWDCSKEELAQKINREKRLLYYFDKIQGLQTTVRINTEWKNYFIRNQEILRGWIQYNMITYLQKRNPSVPGISDKLYPPQMRNLDKVKKFWKMRLEICPVNDIYGNINITKDNISIDHFVPWSYVAHDEMWNLHPTTSNINSSKNNSLPAWDKYFPLLSQQEYESYQLIGKYDRLHDEFEKCAKAHLNSDDVRFRLYRDGQSLEEFQNELSSIIYPVYCSAKNCGFEEWVYQNGQNN